MKVLITGASSGIGRDMARVLAKKGYDLVLVARDEQKLNELEEELKKENNIEIQVISMDLAIEQNCKDLHKCVKDVDILINNAGFGDCGNFTHTDLNKELTMIKTNIVAYHILTKLYLIDMKAIIIYSGKGGVGKTTTTANIARLLAKQGNKVFIIDADINTPSMNTEFEGDHPHEMIWVHSSGNMFSKFIYLEKSMVRQYLELAKKKIHSINPDYVLIDTPPSVTNVHIELLSRVKVSYVLFVTQPTKLSNQDVLRTMDFFHERCGKVNCGIVENMCYGTEHNEYPIRLVAQIPMQDNMNTENLLTNAYNEFQKIVDEIVQSDIVVLEEYSTENGYDENFDVTDIHITGSRKHYFTHELKYDNGVEKTLTLPAMKFLSVRTWDKVRDYIRFHDDLGHLWDERMRRCDTERVGRVVNHFQNDDNAYFMVINAPNTEVHLITGEIGICSLLTGQRGHFELPRVSYQTSKGNVVLFPDEIMPVDINLLQQEINEGYIMLSDGRYLPPKETVQQCYNAFGIRVGLGDNWEDIYDSWNKEMK